MEFFRSHSFWKGATHGALLVCAVIGYGKGGLAVALNNVIDFACAFGLGYLYVKTKK